MTKLLGMAAILLSASVFAFAGTTQTPEIDATSAMGAVGLISGGLLVLRARRK